ncbi:MAG: SDR family oxidoreductase [Deltaproteobacteria bacterium]|jgi:NAD(P)-dependent dehydrogenase (short-subunit alcohol dehydrogenase family)|nr:SDR family oxidoreductase [Deltaproteobacteria bacterium]
MDSKGKVALITGAARIGQVVAQSLATLGCDLALVYRGSREAAEGSAKAAISAGVRAITISADATDKDQVAAAVKEAHSALARIDILVNMAAVYRSTPKPEQADWSNIMDANARSVFLFSTFAAPIMKQGAGGRIINFADWLPVSRRPRYPGFVPYYSSKAAVVALTESLALELAPEILVNAIAPGPILAPPGLTPEDDNEVIKATPLRRWGGAAEIAKTVRFLIESDFITGECIRVDGGRHLY